MSQSRDGANSRGRIEGRERQARGSAGKTRRFARSNDRIVHKDMSTRTQSQTVETRDYLREFSEWARSRRGERIPLDCYM